MTTIATTHSTARPINRLRVKIRSLAPCVALRSIDSATSLIMFDICFSFALAYAAASSTTAGVTGPTAIAAIFCLRGVQALCACESAAVSASPRSGATARGSPARSVVVPPFCSALSVASKVAAESARSPRVDGSGAWLDRCVNCVSSKSLVMRWTRSLCRAATSTSLMVDCERNVIAALASTVPNSAPVNSSTQTTRPIVIHTCDDGASLGACDTYLMCPSVPLFHYHRRGVPKVRAREAVTAHTKRARKSGGRHADTSEYENSMVGGVRRDHGHAGPRSGLLV